MSVLGENLSSRTAEEEGTKRCTLGEKKLHRQVFLPMELQFVSCNPCAAISGPNTPTENQSAIHSETATAVTPGHSLTTRPDENSRSTWDLHKLLHQRCRCVLLLLGISPVLLSCLQGSGRACCPAFAHSARIQMSSYIFIRGDLWELLEGGRARARAVRLAPGAACTTWLSWCWWFNTVGEKRPRPMGDWERGRDCRARKLPRIRSPKRTIFISYFIHLMKFTISGMPHALFC